MSVSTLTFEQLNIDESIIKGLNDVGYTQPTPLQTSVIPVAFKKNDLIVKARSGMGKNGSFIIPVLQQLVENSDETGTRALILTPEVESAGKIDEMIWAIGYHAQIESSVVDMEGDQEEQTEAIKKEPPVVVANPGRLEQILSENRLVFKNIDILVIDEAEKIEKIGIISQVKKVLERVSGSPQTLFYSAEFTEDVKELAKQPVKGEAIYIGFDVFKDVEELDNVESMGLNRGDSSNGRSDGSQKSASSSESSEKKSSEPKKDNASDDGDTEDKSPETFSGDHLKQLKQGYMHVPGRMKISTLIGQIERSSPDVNVIFTASKRGTDRLYKILRKNQKNVTSVFGKLSNRKRDERLEGFREGNYNYLLVADIPAGELGIDNVEQVINYDVPNEVKDYYERTKLVKKGGQVVSLVSKQDRNDIEEIVDKVSPSPEEWNLPEEVKKNKDKKKDDSKQKSRKKGKSDRGKKKDRRKAKKNRKSRRGKSSGKGGDDELELPKPSYDKLSGGRKGKQKKELEDESEDGIFGFVKKLFK